MRLPDGYQDEMRTFPPSDDEIEAIIASRSDESLDGAHGALRQFLVLLETELTSASPYAASHIRRAAAAALGATDEAPQRASVGKRFGLRRRAVTAALTSGFLVKMMAGAVAVAAVGGGAAAATGNLPEPVQTAVADALEVVGIHVPNPAQESAEVATERDGVDVRDDVDRGAGNGEPGVADNPGRQGDPDLTDNPGVWRNPGVNGPPGVSDNPGQQGRPDLPPGSRADPPKPPDPDPGPPRGPGHGGNPGG